MLLFSRVAYPYVQGGFWCKRSDSALSFYYDFDGTFGCERAECQKFYQLNANRNLYDLVAIADEDG